MNRCITCGKLVTQTKAQNLADYDGHKYLVCCPLCEQEFGRDPEYYVAVLRAAVGDYPAKAFSQMAPGPGTSGTGTKEESAAGSPQLISSLERNFAGIRQRFGDLETHLERMTESGGLNGLRNSLNEHRRMMDELRNELVIFSGVCKFVSSVVGSSSEAHV